MKNFSKATVLPLVAGVALICSGPVFVQKIPATEAKALASESTVDFSYWNSDYWNPDKAHMH
ncbi:hypothetical protein GCM10023192_52900 [Amycolatopsis samaneae]